MDSCATYHSAFVDWMLSGVHEVGTVLHGNCNAGVSSTNTKGYYGLWSFWLNKKGIANLLSIPQLEKDGYEVDYNTKRKWVVTTPAGKKIVFKRDTGVCAGMPYIDMREHQEAFAMIETVRKNFEGFTQKQVQDAILARDEQAMLAYPPDQEFNRMVSHKSLKNPRSKPHAISDASAIFGATRAGVRGNTVRKKPERVEADYVEIPRDFYVLHKFVTLVGDVMFVNNIPFLLTLSRKLKFGTVEFLPSRTAPQLGKSLIKVLRLYALRGFVVRCIFMDMEFESVKEHCPMVEINTTAAREHVGEIERQVRTVKGRCRCVVSDLPFRFYYRQIVIRLVYFVVMMLNVPVRPFVRGGVTENFSPRELVTGKVFDVAKHCRARFGEYVEASRDADVTNDMEPRTDACIALGPSGNRQGSVLCLKLSNAKVVVRRTIKQLPMPDRVIKLLNALGKKSGKTSLKFLNRSRKPFAWENDDLDLSEHRKVEMVNPHPEIPAELPGVPLASDFESENAAVTPVRGPSDAVIAAAALKNAGLAETTRVPSKTTGVEMAIDLSGDDSDSEDDMPELRNAGIKGEPGYESDSDSDSDDEDDPPETGSGGVTVEDAEDDDTVGADDPPPEMFGRGMRIRKKPTS